jgi:hypothetical protein
MDCGSGWFGQQKKQLRTTGKTAEENDVAWSSEWRCAGIEITTPP